jgi:hypothetical protein
MTSQRVRAGNRWQLAAIWVAVAGYSWLTTQLRPFTVPVYIAVGVPALVLLGLWVYRSRSGRALADREARPPTSSLAIWAALIGALAAWELAAYVSSPRHAHPTLSSIFDYITGSHPTRAVVFGIWIFLGWQIFLGRSRAERGSL